MTAKRVSAPVVAGNNGSNGGLNSSYARPLFNRQESRNENRMMSFTHPNREMGSSGRFCQKEMYSQLQVLTKKLAVYESMAKPSRRDDESGETFTCYWLIPEWLCR